MGGVTVLMESGGVFLGAANWEGPYSWKRTLVVYSREGTCLDVATFLGEETEAMSGEGSTRWAEP